MPSWRKLPLRSETLIQTANGLHKFFAIPLTNFMTASRQVVIVGINFIILKGNIVGQIVEINLHREFNFSDGAVLDYCIAGVEVDCKYSADIGWMDDSA